MNKSHQQQVELLSDDADAYLASLDASHRRPQFGQNGLPNTVGPFSEEEKKLAFNIFRPPQRADKT